LFGGLLLKHAEHRHFLEPALNHVTMEENAPSPYLVELKDEVTKLDPAEFSHAARLISEGKTCSSFQKYVFKQVNDDLVFVFKITANRPFPQKDIFLQNTIPKSKVRFW